MSRRAAVPAAAKATWARRPVSGCRKRTLRRRFCRPIKHEVGRQLTLWRSVGHLDSLRDQNQSCCSTSRRSRKSTTDPLNMEHMRKQAGRKLAWARCYRYTSSSDQLRVALLKLQPASRRGEHGRRHTPPCPVWRCEIVTWRQRKMCVFINDSVVFVLGRVSSINSLTSGENILVRIER